MSKHDCANLWVMHNNQNQIKSRGSRLLYAALFIIIVISLTVGSYYISRHYIKSINQNQTEVDLVLDKPVETPPAQSGNQETVTPPPQAELPESAEISMWFASQAPYGDWGEPWQNACEEAAIIIVKHYLDQRPLDKAMMHDEVLQLVDWQDQNWGGNRNLTSEKTLLMAKSFYGLNGEVIYDYDVDKIKHYIVSGIPVIIPANGRTLENPNFRNGGPEYHMLVIKGYNSSQFITNDPGTRLGEGYVYSYDIILNSVKNPSGGAKSILILYK